MQLSRVADDIQLSLECLNSQPGRSAFCIVSVNTILLLSYEIESNCSVREGKSKAQSFSYLNRRNEDYRLYHVQHYFS